MFILNTTILYFICWGIKVSLFLDLGGLGPGTISGATTGSSGEVDGSDLPQAQEAQNHSPYPSYASPLR